MTGETALIILNYNDAETTAGLVEAVRDYRSLTHIIVVDNCSPDGSYEKLRSCASGKVEVIRTEANRGYACGNNAGAFYALERYAPEYLFIANPDVLFSEETVRKMTEALASEDGAAVAAPIVNQGYNIWRLPGYWGIIEELFLIWFNLDKRSQKKKLAAKGGIQTVGVAEGSFYCVKSEVFRKIGGLDERTFLYCEENILARRVRTAGYRVIALADERYDHFHGKSIKKHYRSKAGAFHHFFSAFDLYNREYLHTGPLRNGFFRLCYGLAYLERLLYDAVMRLKSRKGEKPGK